MRRCVDTSRQGVKLVFGNVPGLDPGELFFVLPSEHLEHLRALALLSHPGRADLFTGASLFIGGTVTVLRPAVARHREEAPALVSALRATIQGSENRITRLMPKETVKLSMMMNVLAIGLEIDASQIDRLRGRCIQKVKKSNSSITFKDAVKAKNHGGYE